MDDNLYKTPSSNLALQETETISASERLAQSRKEIKHTEARVRLNLVWGIRLIVDILAVMIFAFIFYISMKMETSKIHVVLYGFLIFYSMIEVLCIYAYFNSQRWCLLPLHVFSAVSLLNFPFGTLLSIIHFLNTKNLQFSEK